MKKTTRIPEDNEKAQLENEVARLKKKIERGGFDDRIILKGEKG